MYKIVIIVSFLKFYRNLINSAVQFDCPANERFDNCGTECPKTCENRFVVDQQPCISTCYTGCVCIDGHVRDADGRCVREEFCPDNQGEFVNDLKVYCLSTTVTPTCPPNESFTNCGTLCERSCDTLDEDEECVEACKTGCFCDVGYVRKGNYVRQSSNSLGHCVLEDKCGVEDEHKGEFVISQNLPKSKFQ